MAYLLKSSSPGSVCPKGLPPGTRMCMERTPLIVARISDKLSTLPRLPR